MAGNGGQSMIVTAIEVMVVIDLIIRFVPSVLSGMGGMSSASVTNRAENYSSTPFPAAGQFDFVLPGNRPISVNF